MTILFSAIVRELANAGMSPDDIVLALERIEAKHAEARRKEEEAIIARPSAGAVRQRRYRVKQTENAPSLVTPVTSRDVTPPPHKECPQTPIETTPLLPSPLRELPNVAPSQASGAAVLELVRETDDPEIPASLDRRAYPEWFGEIWAEYRPIASPNSTKADAFRAAKRLSPNDRRDCLRGVIRYVLWLQDERRRRSDTPAKHLATFINRRGWEPFMEEADRAVAG